ncbi:hypothetical protein [Actinoplanes sp. NPDC049265]|uniref:hypothetical protein n=1 Tax=Actinoplanes sp. NPDC049265 TaxID=3363902 RepID=UPI003722657F
MASDETHDHVGRGGVVNLAQGGDLRADLGRPVFRTEGGWPRRSAVPAHLADWPSHLLADADRQVALVGRAGELATLRDWRDASAGFGALLVHGAGGQGKTRLAREFAARSAAAGWAVHRARLDRPGDEPQPGPVPEPAAAAAGRLIIVDRAEQWPLPLLRDFLFLRSLHDARRTRILLLARPAGDWWQRIARHLTGHLGIEPGTLHLGPLPGRQLFDAARDFFARRLDRSEAMAEQPPEGWREPPTALETQMAALARVLAHGMPGRAPADDPGALAAYLIERERERWSEPETLGRAVFLAGLAGPLTHAQATGLVAATGLTAPGEEAGRLIEQHRLSYPSGVLAPLRPERLAEDFVAILAGGRPGRPADPWTAGQAPAVLARLARTMPRHLPRYLLTLIAVAERHAGFSQDRLGPILRDQPEIVVAAGGPILHALARLEHLDAAALAAVELELPLDGPRDLMDPLVTLSRRRYASTRPADPARVMVAYRLSRRLAAAGRHTEAVAAIEDARRRAVPGEETARVLGCHAEVMAGVGLVEAAIQSAYEALLLWAEVGPAHVEYLALRDLYARLLHLDGRPGDAAGYQAATTALWRKRTEVDATLIVRLARSLDAERFYRQAAGDPVGAAGRAVAAASVWERLDLAVPGTHRGELIDAWIAVAVAIAPRAPAADRRAASDRLAAADRLSEADRLSTADRLTATDRLASADRLTAADRLAAAEQAVRASRALWDQDVSAAPRLIRALRAHAAALTGAGRHEQAIKRARAAIVVARRLPGLDSHQRLYAGALLRLALCCLAADTDLRRGHAAAVEALRVFRTVRARGGERNALDVAENIERRLAPPSAPRPRPDQPGPRPDQPGPCPKCNATGKVRIEEWGRGVVRTVTCSRCQGRGYSVTPGRRA